MLKFLGLEKGTNLIFVGNPGVGKSTILNGLTDSTEFPSGNSQNGAGITSEIKRVERDGLIYWDSPGLADMKMRKEAAENLHKLFNQGGQFKIFFVVTGEAGRLRPQDKLTIDQILNSITKAVTGEISYGVIFNKMEPEVLENFENPKHQLRAELTAAMNVDVTTENGKMAKSLHTFGIGLSDDLNRVQPTNNKMPMTPEFKQFIAAVPSIQLTKNKADLVDSEALVLSATNAKFAQMEEILNCMREDKEFFKGIVSQQKDDMQRLMKDSERRERELDELRQAYQDAKDAVKSCPEASAKMPKSEPDGWDYAADMVGAIPGVGGLLSGGIKSLKSVFGY